MFQQVLEILGKSILRHFRINLRILVLIFLCQLQLVGNQVLNLQRFRDHHAFLEEVRLVQKLYLARYCRLLYEVAFLRYLESLINLRLVVLGVQIVL